MQWWKQIYLIMKNTCQGLNLVSGIVLSTEWIIKNLAFLRRILKISCVSLGYGINFKMNNFQNNS